MKKLGSLCKARKYADKLRDEVVEAVRAPKYICEKCLRVSAKKVHLCHPCKLDKWRP